MNPTLPRPTWRILADPLMVLAGIAVLGWSLTRETPEPPSPVPAPVSPGPVEEPAPVPPQPPEPIAPPTLDLEAVGRAEASLEAARRARIEAERKAEAAAEQLAAAKAEAGRAAEVADSLESMLQGPSSQIAALRQQGAAIQAEADRIRAELGSLADAPRPRRKPLIDKTPVARPAQGEEFHFEVRGDRVTYIDLDRLVERVKADAQLQLRLAAGNPSGLARPITSSVGPVGAFALRYEMGRSLPSTMSDLMGSRGVTFSLLGWEVVPVRERRGETFESMQQPASDFHRVLRSLNPSYATITLWVYPDGFAMYRRLNDYLHNMGFLVAARPLPEGMAIRGSPAGSLSAGQ